MCFLEDNNLSECPSQFKLVLYRRYVDDTFCLFKGKNDIFLFLDHINSYHSSIRFTVEIEDNSSLPFLDVLHVFFIRNLDQHLVLKVSFFFFFLYIKIKTYRYYIYIPLYHP